MVTAKQILTYLNEAKDIGLVKGEAKLSLLSYSKAPAWAIELKFTKGKEITGTYYTTGSSGKEVKFFDDEKKAKAAFESLKEKFQKIMSYEDVKSINFPRSWVQPDGTGYPPVDIEGEDNTSAKEVQSVSIKIGTKSINQDKKKAELAKDTRKEITPSTQTIPTIDRLSRQFYKL
jgi:hypothetical protein